MKESYQTVFTGGTAEIIIKKSKFIATVLPVETEEAAIEFIEGMKKKYWDASHNCSAYVIGTKLPLMRCSDDGEPSKTAGKPILDILVTHELTDLVVVVTRYFGGTLLGTGGLVKAYQAATQEGLKQSTIITKETGIKVKVSCDYTMLGKIQYLAAQEHITILSSEYTELVELILLIPSGILDYIKKRIAEHTNGSAILEAFEPVYFSIIDNKVHLFSC